MSSWECIVGGCVWFHSVRVYDIVLPNRLSIVPRLYHSSLKKIFRFCMNLAEVVIHGADIHEYCDKELGGTTTHDTFESCCTSFRLERKFTGTTKVENLYLSDVGRLLDHEQLLV